MTKFNPTIYAKKLAKLAKKRIAAKGRDRRIAWDYFETLQLACRTYDVKDAETVERIEALYWNEINT